MKKKLFGLVSVALLSVGLVACSDKAEEPKETAQTETETQGEATGNVVEVKLTAKNFEFNPATIDAKVGDTVKLTLENETGLHGAAIDEFDVDLKAGETVEFVVTEAGEFEIYCSIPCGQGHDNMVTTIVVS